MSSLRPDSSSTGSAPHETSEDGTEMHKSVSNEGMSSVQEAKADDKGGPVAPQKFSVFTTREKWVIIALAALAAIFSPLSTNSYFPAIQIIADAFNTSVELINVTVTVYMFLQGLTPMIWGTISDRVGRRPIFLACMAILSITCVGLALVPTDAYWLLLVLRCLQAAGSASTVALGSGTISDIAQPHERGGFVGLFNTGPLIGPCIGPIIGGLLAGNLGWRSIFWFLAIASGIDFIILLLVFPETLRVIVGDGSIPPPHFNRPLIPILSKYDPSSTVARPPPKKFINPLLQFTHPSVVCVLLFNGTVYSVFYGVTATLSTLFAEAYPFLTETDIGLCFLTVGAGCAVGSYTNGKILDADFRRIKKQFDKGRIAENNEKGDPRDLQPRDLALVEPDFPIEYARLRTTPMYLGLFVAASIGYGWSIQRAVHMSCPLILSFIIGWASMSVMNTSQTILMDLYPAQGSSITAANNLVRCTMGATLVSVVDFILRALGPGWTYVLLAGVCVLMWPLTFPVMKYGPRWRARQKAKADARDN